MKELIRKYWDIFIYLVFGILTTVVNYLVYLPCYNQFGFSAAASNLIAWVVAVMFAFLTNKPFVFQSNDWSAKTVFPELWKFLTCRICSGLMETVIILITVDILSWNGNWMKLATNVLVIIVNYIGSKLIVFRKKGK